MDLTPYLEGLRSDLAAVAAPGGPDTARAAELLSNSLEPSARLALLEALSDAAAEITTRLTDATVEVRLRGREADLVVTQLAAAEPSVAVPPPVAPVDGGDLARLTLRMPEALKTQVEQTAAAEGVSVNAWLVRAVSTAVNQRPGSAPPPAFGGAMSAKRVTGYFQA
ncbi:hypothetical protein GCM10010168_32270 [Actinoplanes ianthinogenes]|uniref:Toxin-antitoxin system HicB family antitoxin n=1 Tax=Actinoplanes ianthinogenes TaxID=122358 RepID=A0ABM7LM72_9ACTN|nr:toxin-antitoxin system HicB family antitoxin [Actinoplanes ianthinogenes]BCJ40368.1 hypothetical protein Aiant_10250 [Actinoplanes ianthinogenes]GGR11744.1 hypothetical protein GCM10010168_32270 [Actinoplanes ianthinogenes]